MFISWRSACMTMIVGQSCASSKPQKITVHCSHQGFLECWRCPLWWEPWAVVFVPRPLPATLNMPTARPCQSIATIQTRPGMSRLLMATFAPSITHTLLQQTYGSPAARRLTCSTFGFTLSRHLCSHCNSRNFFGFWVTTRHHAMRFWPKLEEMLLSASRSFLYLLEAFLEATDPSFLDPKFSRKNKGVNDYFQLSVQCNSVDVSWKNSWRGMAPTMVTRRWADNQPNNISCYRRGAWCISTNSRTMEVTTILWRFWLLPPMSWISKPIKGKGNSKVRITHCLLLFDCPFVVTSVFTNLESQADCATT